MKLLIMKIQIYLIAQPVYLDVQFAQLPPYFVNMTLKNSFFFKKKK